MIVARQFIAWNRSKMSPSPRVRYDEVLWAYSNNRVVHTSDHKIVTSLRDGSIILRIPGNKLPGYVHAVPPGQGQTRYGSAAPGLAQYSNTPRLHHSAQPNSRTRTTTITRTKRLSTPASSLDFPANPAQPFWRPVNLKIERSGARVQIVDTNAPGKPSAPAERTF
jgi:hypothetical protein